MYDYTVTTTAQNRPLPSEMAQAYQPTSKRSVRQVLTASAFNRNQARQQEEIASWRQAMERAESNFQPLVADLQRIFDEIELDPHLIAAWRQRRSNLLGSKFEVKTQSGVDVTPLVRRLWFYDWLKAVQDARGRGFSLVGLGDVVNGELTGIQVKERHLVSPVHRLWLNHPSVLSGISLDTPEIRDWYILLDTKTLGEFNPAVPYVLQKRFVFKGWTEFAQVFGLPLKVAYADTQDGVTDPNKEGSGRAPQLLDELDKTSLGGSLVLGQNEKLELLQAANTDAYRVFKDHFETSNGEISKLILGQTMTTENGSSRSQAEVHERVAQAIFGEDKMWAAHCTNTELFPRLIKLGILPPTSTLTWLEEEPMSITEAREVLLAMNTMGLKPKDLGYFQRRFGIEVEDKPQPAMPPPGRPGFPPPFPSRPAGRASQRPAMTSRAITAVLEDSAIHEAIARAYSDVCPDCGGRHVVAEEDEDDRDIPELQGFDDGYLESVLMGVHGGRYTADTLPVDLYSKIAAYLFSGVEKGMGGRETSFAFGSPSRGLIQQFKQNIYVFAGAKTWHQLKAVSSALYDKKGNLTSWPEFRKKTLPIFQDYNQNWLHAEYLNAVASGRMGDKWLQCEADAEFLPHLRYRTIGDAQVRESHRLLEGVTRPVSDPYWDIHYPPNGWRCRCTVEQHRKGVRLTPVEKLPSLPVKDQPEVFRMNPGKDKIVFSKKHPYFRVAPADRERAMRNFDLPLPTIRPEPIRNAPPALPTPASLPPSWPAYQDLTVVRPLGGSTGAKLVKDAAGNEYVLKRGGNTGHLKEEMQADALYRAMGIDVPDSVALETPEGTAKLARFVKGRTLGEFAQKASTVELAAVRQKLQEGFAADALLGNWDVVGLSEDNILITEDGLPMRIDNGGSLRYRAQGALKKDGQFAGNHVADLWTLRDSRLNATAAKAYAGLGTDSMLEQMRGLAAKSKAILASIDDPALAEIIKARLAVFKDYARVGETMRADTFNEEYVEGFLRQKNGIREAGLTQRMPDRMSQKNAKSDSDKVMLLDGNGKLFDDLRGSDSTMAAFVDWVNGRGKGSWALAEKYCNEQGGSSWSDTPCLMKYHLSQYTEFQSVYWQDEMRGKAEKSYPGFLAQYGKEKVDNTFWAMHAWTHELLTHVDLPRVDRKKALVRLKRTENREDVMSRYDLKVGDKGKIIDRGLLESCSLYRWTNPTGNEQTLQNVPLHRIFYTYLQSLGKNSQSTFHGDHENEFVAMLPGLPLDYVGNVAKKAKD